MIINNMSDIVKSIKRVQQATTKSIIYNLIDKIKNNNLSETEIESKIDECLLTLDSRNNANKTKRGRSGYNIFVSEKSAEMNSKSTEKISFKEMSKNIADMWKSLDQEEKNIYNEKAKNLPKEDKKHCAGTKGDGSSCTNKIKTNSNFCGQHVPKEEKEVGGNKCQAKTRKGEPCTRNALDGQDLCKMHITKSSEISEDKIQKCMGLTKNKDPCSRNATVGEYCKKHAEQYNFKGISETTVSSFPKSVQIGHDTANLITFNKKQYYIGEDNDVCYNASTHAEIGYWNAETEKIIFNE